MGPNGSGKSTLAHVLAGRDGYEVTPARSSFEGKDLLAHAPRGARREGVFLAFQYPVEIPGVANRYFLKAALNAVRKHRGQSELDAIEFLKLAREQDEAGRDGSRVSWSARSTRASRAARRSATRSSRWRCSSRSSRSSTRPTPASTSTRCASSPRASTRCAGPSARWSSSPTTSACSTTSCPTACTCCRTAASCESGGKELALELEAEGYAQWLEGTVEPQRARRSDRHELRTRYRALR